MALSVKRISVEVFVRLVLFLVFWYTETVTPFIRIIQKEEWWLYNYPHVKNTRVPTRLLYTLVIAVPVLTILLFSGVLTPRRKVSDVIHALLCSSLAFVLNGILTNMIKLTVGRPRPDFFKRCYPNGAAPLGQPSVNNLVCFGDPDLIIEGRKSFPSGHSSMSFMAFGFCALYIAGKLQVLSRRRGDSMRLVMSILPLCCALLVAISRTCDYRHHWQDVVVGSALGMSVSYCVYFQYYPSLFDQNCHLPLWSSSTPLEKDETASTGGEGPSEVLLASSPVRRY